MGRALVLQTVPRTPCRNDLCQLNWMLAWGLEWQKVWGRGFGGARRPEQELGTGHPRVWVFGSVHDSGRWEDSLRAQVLRAGP